MMTTHVERTYKSLWHLAIASIGFYELRNHKTLLSKVLACGLIAFHADAAICDAIGIPTTPQRFIKGILNANLDSDKRNTRRVGTLSGAVR